MYCSTGDTSLRDFYIMTLVLLNTKALWDWVFWLSNYRTRAIISRGLYFFYPIFHCGYYCREACTAERLIFHNYFFPSNLYKNAIQKEYRNRLFCCTMYIHITYIHTSIDQKGEKKGLFLNPSRSEKIGKKAVPPNWNFILIDETAKMKTRFILH